MILSRPRRLAAAAIALAALVSLCIQFAAEWIALGDAASVAQTLWIMARFFTVLTNTAVAVFLAITAINGRWRGPGWPAAITVWIVAVGVVYHALLASTNVSTGFKVWSNFGMHTLVPLLTLLLWLWAAPKTRLTFLHTILWTAYPLIYAIYALVRGLIDGRFPYFFLDPARIGWPMVIAFILGLGVFFVLSGSAFVLLTRLLNRAKQTKATN